MPSKTKPEAEPDLDALLPLEVVALTDLRPHPRNYRSHPDPEVIHIAESIRENGVYRNVVVARDGTLLAGHGVVLAMARLGRTSVPVRRLPLDPDSTAAIKILASDNEVSRLAEDDDRMLAEILAEIRDSADADLLGTGYDSADVDAMLSRYGNELLAGEVVTDPQAEWEGMPEYQHEDQSPSRTIYVHFRSSEDVSDFARIIGQPLTDSTKAIWHPCREKKDHEAYRYDIQAER